MSMSSSPPGLGGYRGAPRRGVGRSLVVGQGVVRGVRGHDADVGAPPRRPLDACAAAVLGLAALLAGRPRDAAAAKRALCALSERTEGHVRRAAPRGLHDAVVMTLWGLFTYCFWVIYTCIYKMYTEYICIYTYMCMHVYSYVRLPSCRGGRKNTASRNLPCLQEVKCIPNYRGNTPNVLIGYCTQPQVEAYNKGSHGCAVLFLTCGEKNSTVIYIQIHQNTPQM